MIFLAYQKMIEEFLENNTLSSVEGATALKLDENAELSKSPTNLTAPEPDPAIVDAAVSGVSIESASYMENNSEDTVSETDQTKTVIENQEEFTPQLFSEEVSNEENRETEEKEEFDHSQDEKLFDQDVNEDEESFAIPAFLRKQKF